MPPVRGADLRQVAGRRGDLPVAGQRQVRNIGGQAQLNNASPNNYGCVRNGGLQSRNTDRTGVRSGANSGRAAVNEQRWFASRYANSPGNRQNQRAFEDREQWRENFLRSVVVNVLSSNSGYYDNAYPVYEPYYYGIPYDPAYYGAVYYDSYPGYASAPYYYGGPTFQIDYTSGNGGYAFYSDVGADGFPYSDFADPYSGNMYARQEYGQLLTYGYDQGYTEGLAARDAGYDDQNYTDPYAYNDVIYDPYSNSLGENRRCLGKGYELGYMDAVYGRDEYDPDNYGNVNMVSAFVSDVSIVL